MSIHVVSPYIMYFKIIVLPSQSDRGFIPAGQFLVARPPMQNRTWRADLRTPTATRKLQYSFLELSYIIPELVTCDLYPQKLGISSQCFPSK